MHSKFSDQTHLLLINYFYFIKHLNLRPWWYNTRNYHIKTREIKAIILPVVLYDCETWSLTLREESRLREFEKRSRDEYLGPRGMGMRSGESSTMRKFVVCTIHLI